MASTAPLTLRAAGKTDVGVRRQHNEDSFACDSELSLFVVADGMGGHAAGEIASARTVETMREFIGSFEDTADFTWPFGVDKALPIQANLLLNAIRVANRTVCSLAQERPEYSGMGTTVVCCHIEGSQAILAHVGDSRAYLLRGKRLELLTEDHSWVQEQIREQLLTVEEAKNHRWRNVITRALGNRFEIEVDWQTADLKPGDTLLLCTDGLSGPVEEDRLAAILLECGDNVEEACDRLIDEANRGGGPDNITAVVVHLAASG
jgi:protein phosphatase